MGKTLLVTLFFVLISYAANAQFGFFASAPYIHANDTTQFYNTFDQQPDPSAIGEIDFQGADLGTYVENSDSLYLLGGEIKTFKNGNGNVCSADMFYTIYPVGDRPLNPVFTDISLAFFDNCSGGAFPTGGPCMDGDQKWQTANDTMNLTAFPEGVYTIEIYYQVNGTNDNNCGDSIVYDNNNSNPTNYTATFTITSVVPVILQSFDAVYNNDANTVSLQWTDDEEINNKGFEIQRSTDGINFSDINWQNSVSASALANTYTYNDNSLPGVSEVFYRLKIVDDNGSFTYSKVIPVMLPGKISLTVLANDNNINIYASGLNQGMYAAMLYAIDGSLMNSQLLKVLESNTAFQYLTIKSNKLSKGVYIIILRDVNGNVIAKKNFIN